MDLGFLDNIWQPVGKGLSEADTFMNREMPFHSSWGAPAALIASYFGGPAVMEAMGSAEGAGAGAGAGNGALDTMGGSTGIGDVFGGWSPTGSSADGMGSGLGMSSSNPLAYNDPYAAQDVMQQARDTTGITSGSPTSWDTATSATSPADKLSFQQMLGKQLMQSNLGGSMQQRANFQQPEQPVQRQPAFAPTPAPFQVQDKQADIAALVAALRNKGTL